MRISETYLAKVEAEVVRLREALAAIKTHQFSVGGNFSALSTTYQIANEALSSEAVGSGDTSEHQSGKGEDSRNSDEGGK